jgi:hypothetical protein
MFFLIEPSYHWWSPFIGGTRGSDVINTECQKISPPSAPDDSESQEELMFCEDQLIDLISEKKVKMNALYHNFCFRKGILLFFRCQRSEEFVEVWVYQTKAPNWNV